MLLIKNKPLRQIAGLIETCSFLTIKLLLKNPKQLRTFPGRLFREYMRAVGKERWYCKDILDILELNDQSVRIEIEHLPGKGIDTPLDELACLALITKAFTPKRIFEIGTFRGRTALNFAINSPKDCIVYTLDLPDLAVSELSVRTNAADRGIIAQRETGRDYVGKPEAEKIVQLLGNSVEFDYQPYLGTIDIVFVDGAHDYDVVKSDTKNALSLLKPGGCIIWHDFANYGDYNDVVRAVLDLIPAERIIQISNTQLAIYQQKDPAK